MKFTCLLSFEFLKGELKNALGPDKTESVVINVGATDNLLTDI